MEQQRLLDPLRESFDSHPYLTIAALAGLGWMLSRRTARRAVLALAGLGARVAVASALEGAVRERIAPAPRGGRSSRRT